MPQQSEIAELVAALVNPDPRHPRPGHALHAMGPRVVPALAAAYETTGRWQGRAALVVAAMRHARECDEAVALGLRALNDRATLVRYRACGLLAYAQRTDALPALRALLTHPDAPTRADAAAAITAIETGNHHRFVDRGGLGNITWRVNDDDDEAPAGAAALTRSWITKLRRLWRGVAKRVGAD